MSRNGERANEANEENGLPALSQLYFYLTHGCNLACRHCYLTPKFDPNAGDGVLSVDHFEMAIREAKPLGLTAVKLTGGEPLLNPRIERMLEIVRREELTLRMESNGVLCTPELARQIAACKDAFISVSLDGADAETHEWVRGVPGSFEGAKTGIRNLVDAGMRPQVILTIMRRNADHVEPVIRLAEQLGCGSVKFNVVQPMGRGELLVHDESRGLEVPELIELGRRVDMVLQEQTKLTLYFDYPMAFRPLSRIANGGSGTCGILGILGVIASGHYAICGVGDSIADLVYGEVGLDSLEEIWNTHPKLAMLRDGVPARLTGICGRCLMKHRCLGSCVAQNYYKTGELLAPYWFCEQAEADGLFPASRFAG